MSARASWKTRKVPSADKEAGGMARVYRTAFFGAGKST